ncbi:hypothetical protein, conserved [Trypanosoma brucei gambiense DAL972]|uniref:Uncharacterized protein n=1 Tax=Trypanosoma brucei gambiense (strain MHOM/CI/86/DAL972) TaxID=679716 RepID=C9ZPD6_TRYB9|nr:hypothetical protein, conserved [Trypanosoma brucei gambiense DAL972]CBH11264.1 hypothetical protein, conserved [Trypanosoma brucei gambiense DAL972]|eukprot:XP_011773551.1 hypothetical protein, conserved [Trypanosoma brucei gambiense DAL972]
MTESAYLKCSVGPVLAKAVAETVLAQPSNPQEYIALYLLHVLQEEQNAAIAATRQAKVEALRQAWAGRRALREKRAADTIQRFFRQCQAVLRARRAEEEELWNKYEEAEAEADDLLGDVAGEKDHSGDALPDAADVDDAAAAVEDARVEFYKAHRFMLYIRKALLGMLKKELVDRREEVRMEQDKMHDALEVATEEAQKKDEAEAIAAATKGTLPSSDAMEKLVRQVTLRQHEKISAPMILFRVLRCWCYFLFDSTPKQVSTPADVAALLKPFKLMQLLRAFNPVGSYQRSRPLRLEDNLQNANDMNSGDDMQDGDVPIPQPKPRQARRVGRVLRVLLHDGEYICGVNPADHIDAEGSGADEEHEALEAAAAAADRAANITSRVEETAKKHSVILYALLRLLRTASAYRDARDKWLQLLTQAGREVPAAVELPEEDVNDPNDEEALRDEDDEVDEAAVRRLLLQIGVDTDEALAKLWIEADSVERAKWEGIAAARLEEEGQEEGSGGDGEGSDGDEGN